MDFTMLLLIGAGLSMDAFAAAVCKGLNMRVFSVGKSLVIGAMFGVFQAAMPLAGFYFARLFAGYIEAFDHWVAFALLVLIGGNMIREVIKEIRNPKAQEKTEEDRLNFPELLALSVATSIDALAVGVSFACLEVRIFPAVAVIGITTFALSFAGCGIGNKFGTKYKNKAGLAGGIVLILIGIKILLEHLEIINF